MGRRNVWQEKGYELKQSRKLNRKIEAKLSRKTGILVRDVMKWRDIAYLGFPCTHFLIILLCIRRGFSVS